VVTGILAAALVAAGLLAAPVISHFLNAGIRQLIVVDSVNAKEYDEWQDSRYPTVPLTYMKFYLFNLTNADDVLQGAVPDLQQVGPYSYIEQNVRTNVSWTDNGNILHYLNWEFYQYDPNTSAPGVDPINDRITTLVLGPAAVRANLPAGWLGDTILATLMSFSGEPIFVTQSPNATIFGGADPLFDFLQRNFPSLPMPSSLGIQSNVTSPDNLPYGFEVMFTGKNDTSLVHQYLQWNSSSTLPLWGSAEANAVIGTDGYNFAPGLNSNETLLIFIDTLFRQGVIGYNGTVTIQGIDMYQYTLLPWQLLNSTSYPPNEAYYSYNFPNGMMNLSIAFSNTPVFVSKPHFLDADPYYLTTLNGLSPNRTLHETYIYVEPITGIMMSSYERLQINVYTSPLQFMYPNLSAVYFPVLWLEQGGVISANLAAQFRTQVYGARTAKEYAPLVAFVLAGLLAALAALFALNSAGVFGPRASIDDEEKTPLLVNEQK